MAASASSVPQWLDALAQALGDPVLPDANGECGLDFEGGIQVVVAAAGGAESALVTLRAAVLPSVESGGYATYGDALRLNYGALPPGHTLAIDPDSGLLMLLLAVDASRFAARDFTRVLGTFVGCVADVRERLQPHRTAS